MKKVIELFMMLVKFCLVYGVEFLSSFFLHTLLLYYAVKFDPNCIFLCLQSGIHGLICLESDNEPGSGCGGEKNKENESMHGGFGLAKVLDWSPTFVESPCSLGIYGRLLAFVYDSSPGIFLSS